MSKRIVSILLPLLLAAGLVFMSLGKITTGSLLSMIAILISSLWDYDLDMGINHVFATLFMLLASYFYEFNLLYAVALFEIGILFSIGFQGIKERTIALVPIFLIGLTLWSGAWGNTQYNLNVIFPILFIIRTLSFSVVTPSNSKNWSYVITFSLLVSSWWNVQVSTSVILFSSIIGLELILKGLKLKRKNTMLFNLLACLLALIFLKIEPYPLLILLVMQALTQRLQKDLSISREELMIFCVTILVLFGTISTDGGVLETITVLACVFLPLLGLKKMDIVETKIVDVFGARSFLNMALCLLGVVLFAFS